MKGSPRSDRPGPGLEARLRRVAETRAHLDRDLDAVQSQVRQALDWKAWVGRHPVLATIGSGLVGLVAIRALWGLGRPRAARPAAPAGVAPGRSLAATLATAATRSLAPLVIRQAGLFIERKLKAAERGRR